MATKKTIGVIDDGIEKIPLTNKFGDLICEIRFRPADLSIVDRYNALMKDFDGLSAPLHNVELNADGTPSFDAQWAAIKEVEAGLVDRINAVFDMKNAADIFKDRNAFSSVGGVFYVERVLEALGEIVADAVQREGEASAQRMNKYLADKK